MSVKADVKIVMLKESYEELNNKISTQGFEDYKLFLWENKKEESVVKYNTEFIILSWNYIKWDYDTDELVEMIVDYLHMLEKNDIPCRYIALYDVGTEDELLSYGKNPALIGYIAGCIYISKEIKVNDSFYEICN